VSLERRLMEKLNRAVACWRGVKDTKEVDTSKGFDIPERVSVKALPYSAQCLKHFNECSEIDTNYNHILLSLSDAPPP
jgi:hypothetical protein